MDDLLEMLPRGKYDTKRAAALVALGYPAVELILPQLLEWLQDYNWRVAQALEPLLANIGPPLAPYIRPILETDDTEWIYWIVTITLKPSKELSLLLKDDLEALRRRLTDEDLKAEIQEALDLHFGIEK